MLRAPRINPRPRTLHENPSGVAVAIVAAALGAVGAVGYLVYKTKTSLDKAVTEGKIKRVDTQAKGPHVWKARKASKDDFLRANTFVITNGKTFFGLQFAAPYLMADAPAQMDYIKLTKNAQGLATSAGRTSASSWSKPVLDEVMQLLQDAQEQVSDMPPRKGIEGLPAKAVSKDLGAKIMAVLRKDSQLAAQLERDVKEWSDRLQDEANSAAYAARSAK